MNHPSKFDPRGIVPEGKKWKKRKPLHDLLGKYKTAPSGCWEWTGTTNRQGYGVVGLFIDNRPIGIPAPRLQWMHSHGPIPDGLVIMHTCDNPPCINPDHLALGTQASNLTNMRAKGRADQSGLLNFDKVRNRYQAVADEGRRRAHEERLRAVPHLLIKETGGGNSPR